MYKPLLKSFLFGIISLFIFCYAKNIDEHVSETYLCKSLPPYTTEYIKSQSENLIETNDQTINTISFDKIIAISILLFGSTLVLRYLFCIQEKKNINTTILIQNKEF